MKNPYVRYTVQFALFFFILAAFYGAVGMEDVKPIWEKSIGEYLIDVIGVFMFGMLVFALPIIFLAKRVGDKHKKYHKKYNIPYANDKGQCICGQS